MECALSLESRFRSCTMTAQSSPTPIYIWMLRKDKKAWRRTDVLEVWNGLTSKSPGKNLKHEMQASDWQELFRDRSKPGSALQAVSLPEKDRACFIHRQKEKPGMHLIWRVVGRTSSYKILLTHHTDSNVQYLWLVGLFFGGRKQQVPTISYRSPMTSQFLETRSIV